MRKTKPDVFSGFTGKIGKTGFYKRILNGVEVIQQCPTRKTNKRDQSLDRVDKWSYQTESFIADLNGAILHVTAIDFPDHSVARSIPL